MKFGLTGIHTGKLGYPDTMVRMARAAEEAGFDSLWAGEHPVLAEDQSRIPLDLRLPDPAVALSFIAGNTSKIRLGTGVILLPEHNPLVLAKALATLDLVSNRRLIFGLGVGWSEHEYVSLGLSYHDRGARADDYLKAIQALWTMQRPSYQGKYVSFERVRALPLPVQKPHPPIVIGGYSPAAFRRAVLFGNGWFGYSLTVEDTKKAIDNLSETQAKFSRPEKLGDLEISVAPRGKIDKAAAHEYSNLGVHRLVLIPPPELNVVELEKYVRTVPSSLG